MAVHNRHDFHAFSALCGADKPRIVTHGANVRKAYLMKTERSEGHHEATKALALAIAEVTAIMLIWNLVMLILY
jgi:hypothetical protein